MKMRVGITGASGMLGTALINELGNEHEIFATSRRKGREKEGVQWDCFDLTNLQQIDRWLIKTSPDVVIHCAAIVNVDLCEEDIDLATRMHFDTTKTISNYLNCNNKKLIYISTDSVFDGKKNRPYVELDKTNPLNVYAKTKLLGENSVLSMKDGLALRTNIIGWSGADNVTFAEWILKGLIENKPLTLFDDVMFSPLNVSDLSAIINQIIGSSISGLYHCASKDCISKYDFGIKMAEVFNMTSSNIKRISVDEMAFKAERPKNMALDIKKISSVLEYDFPSAVDSIKLMRCQFHNKDKLENNYLKELKEIG